MASLKLFQLPPLTICIYLFLTVASSSIWFAGFTFQILHHGAESPHPPNRLRGILLEAALVVAYVLHFAIAVCVPICSRPWLWNLESKKSADFLEIFMIAMGYDDYEEEHWTIGGSRSVAAFAVALIPFLVPIERSAWGIAAIVALAAESFFLAETEAYGDGRGVFLRRDGRRHRGDAARVRILVLGVDCRDFALLDAHLLPLAFAVLR